MKASELIKELQESIDLCGDLPVFIPSNEYEADVEVEQVTYWKAPRGEWNYYGGKCVFIVEGV